MQLLSAKESRSTTDHPRRREISQKILTPSDWIGSVLLMNFPLSISNREPNNVWMTHNEPYDQPLACRQWLDLYKYVAQRALVYVLPGHGNLQDLPFVANLACYLPHMIANVVILSNFTSIPRKREAVFGSRFFGQFHYIVEPCPYPFEGEADLKWVRDNIYIGGIGQRSSKRAFQWMRDSFDMEIIEIELTDPKLYHLDCVFMRLSDCSALVNTSVISPRELRKLTDVVSITAVPDKHKYDGWTNGLVLDGELLTGASIPSHMINSTSFTLTEFEKSGADLSCLFMHMNYK